MGDPHEVTRVGAFDEIASGDAPSKTVAWERGFDVAAVAAGSPFPRPDVVTDLIDQLRDSHTAVVGGVAVGKSTLCLLAARKWRRADVGPVFQAPQPPGNVARVSERLRRTADAEEGQPLLVVENALADDGATASELVDEFDQENVTVLLEIQERDLGVTTEATAATETPLAERIGDELTLFDAPTVDADAFADAVAHYEARTGTTVPSDVGTLYDALRTETAEGNVLMHFAHWVGTGRDSASALDGAVAEAYETLADADDLVLDAAAVAALLTAADMPLYLGFFFGLDASNDAVDEAVESLLGVVLFYPERGVRFASYHRLWATRFLETLLERDDRARERFASAVHAVLEMFDADRRRETWSWLGDESRHAPHLLPSDDDASAESNDARPASDGLLTSDARRRRDAVGTTGQVVDRLVDVGTTHPSLAALYGTSDDGELAFEEYCSTTTTANALLARGRMHFDNGAYDRAETEFERALDVLERDDDVPDAVVDRFEVRYNVARGRTSLRRSEFERAYRYYRVAYDVSRDLGDPKSRARSHLHLGVAATKRGRFPAATAHLEASRRLFRDRGEHHLVAGVLQRIGVVYWLRGRLEDAERVLGDGLDRFERAGDRVGVAKCRNNLGLVARERDALDAARTRFERSLRTSTDVGYRPGELKSRLNLGNLAMDRGEYDAATEHYEACRMLAVSLGDREEEATAVNNLGVVALERGDLEAAATAYERSLEICRDIGDRAGEGRALANVGEVARERDRYDRALDRLRESLRIRRETDDRVGAARTEHELGRCLLDCGDRENAREHLESALSAFESFDANRKGAAVLEDFGRLARDAGAVERAVEHLREAYERYGDDPARESVLELLRDLDAAATRELEVDH